MLENRVAASVVDAAYRIHTCWGPGLLESAYVFALDVELRSRGHQVAREVPLTLTWRAHTFEAAYRIDFLVDGCVVVEVKSVERTAPVHKKQVITYLKLSGCRLGLLVNFGAPLIKQGITRLAHRLPD